VSRDVTGDLRDLAAVGAKVFDEGLGLAGLEAVHSDRGPLAREQFGDPGAGSAIAPGHERHPTAQSEIHSCAPPGAVIARSARRVSDQSDPPTFTLTLEFEIRLICDEGLDAADHLGVEPTLAPQGFQDTRAGVIEQTADLEREDRLDRVARSHTRRMNPARVEAPLVRIEPGIQFRTSDQAIPDQTNHCGYGG
jgi:hypothetical protein